MDECRYNLTVETKKAVDTYKDCTFTLGGEVLCIDKAYNRFCYPLVNVLMYTYKKVQPYG